MNKVAGDLPGCIQRLLSQVLTAFWSRSDQLAKGRHRKVATLALTTTEYKPQRNSMGLACRLQSDLGDPVDLRALGSRVSKSKPHTEWKQRCLFHSAES